MKCKEEENLKDCPCTWPDRLRKGICCQGIKYHQEKRELPSCYFSERGEKSYDQSI
jgi:hypothetical protein